MTDKLKELLPCPFCSDKHPRLSKYRNSDPAGTLIGYVWRVECENCGANTCLGIERTEEQAVSTWNCRAPLPAVEAAEIEVVGYCRPVNISLMKAGKFTGFMVHDEKSSVINCALMTVAQHRRILAGVNQQAGSGVPEYGSYTTTPGESVAGIALRQLKDESRWVEIRDLNAHAFPCILAHEYYPVGTVLRMPLPPSPAAKAGEA